MNNALAANNRKVLGEFNLAKVQPKRRNNIPGKRDDRLCTHCNTAGHTKDTCFKFHGYLDWFVELRKNKQGKSVAVMVSQTTETPMNYNQMTKNEEWANIMQMQQEILKRKESHRGCK